MKTYEYRGMDKGGRACRGLIEALNVKDAREKLAGRGVLAEQMNLTGRETRLTGEARAMVYRELGALLAAGMTLVRALDIMIQSPELASAQGLLAGVRDRVREGASLVAALSDASRSFTPFEVAILDAGERSARVETMLERLAVFLEEESRLRERIQGALIYPAIVLGVGICVSILMLGLLLPRARDILSGSPTPLPRLTRGMMGFGRGVAVWGAPAAAVLVLLGTMLGRRRRLDVDFRRRVDRWLFRLPLVGRGYRILVNMRFARTLSILLDGGVPLIDGMVLAGRATGSCWIGHLVELEAESVRHGGRLSDAVRRIPPLSEWLPGWILIGEASGGMSRLVESAGQRYQQWWERFTSRCLSVVEPALILLIGGFVLLVTVSVLLPVISLSQSVVR